MSIRCDPLLLVQIEGSDKDSSVAVYRLLVAISRHPGEGGFVSNGTIPHALKPLVTHSGFTASTNRLNSLAKSFFKTLLFVVDRL